ncbi:MAG: glycosyltransferase family 4 protein [Ignavibacteriales bacterium]|nr:glycosyltransferase family 4 protein [Ignavibacteriales bacterium]
MKKKILLITQYYPPEMGGGSQRSVGFAEELHDAGLEVVVIAPFPTYLMTEVKTKVKLYEKSSENGITIYHTYVYASDRGKFLKRMAYYLSFMLSALIVALFVEKKSDFHITISPPLFTGIPGILLKWFKKSKFIFDIGDLWPESAIQLGFLKNRTAINIAEQLERWIYRNADFVNVVTRGTYEKVKLLHPYIKKVLYIPNFVRTSLITKTPKDQILLKELNLGSKFICGYAGNIGGAQGLKMMTDAAKLTLQNTKILYLIIGDGVEKELLEQEIEKHSLKNVLLLPPVSREKIISYISLFDIMFIPLVKNKLFTITIPSKLYEAMAAEIPVILSVDGEARKLLEEAKCGYFCEPENSAMLAKLLSNCIANNEKLCEIGRNGRISAIDNFDRKTNIRRFLNQING